MTEKRFYVKAQPLGYSTGYSYELIDVENELTDIDGDFLIFKYEDDADTVCELLNKLNDENQQLKHDASVLINANRDYRKENEELKNELLKYKAPNCRKCMEYSADYVADYCMHKDSPIGQWSMFPSDWDYEKGAKECKYYDEDSYYV